jgi:hypothetical protein
MDEGKKKVSPSCSIFDDVFALADRSVCFYSVRARSVVQLGNGYIAVRSTAMRKTSTSVPVCLLLHPHHSRELRAMQSMYEDAEDSDEDAYVNERKDGKDIWL